jgi:hypothetical protein
MYFELFVTFLVPLFGVVGGVLANRLPASGKVGLAVGLVPVAGVYLAMKFC